VYSENARKFIQNAAMKNYTIVVTHNTHLFHISELSYTYTCTQRSVARMYNATR